MSSGSWKTSLLGYAMIVLDVIQFIAQAIEKQGMPTNVQGWIVTLSGLAGGIGLIVAKDWDKSNAPRPESEAKTVPEAK